MRRVDDELNLITLVPAGDELIIEAFLLNCDVGFVKRMQPLIIKLEAFPFMRYGFLEGEVEHVSPDAIIDEARGLVYPARIRITGSTLRTERLGLGANSTQNSVQGSNTSKREGAGSPARDLCDASASRDQIKNCPSEMRGTAGEQAQVKNTSDHEVADDLTKDKVWGRDVMEHDELKTALALTQPGMAVTAEIKTGTRSVISYLLSPIAKATSEAGRER